MDLALTKSGRRRVSSLSAQGVAGQMLGLLQEHGSLSVEELASLMRVSTGRAKAIANKLHKNDLIRVDNDA